MEQIKTKNIYQKIQAVMSGSSWLRKTGKNQLQKYDYATAADAFAMIRQQMIEIGLTVSVVYENEKFEQIVYGRDKNLTNLFSCAGVFVIADTESGDKVTCRIPGHAMDSGDKAPWKCLTGIMKYFLFQTFMIPTGDGPKVPDDIKPNHDPEQDDPPAPKAAPKAEPRETLNRWMNYLIPRENIAAIEWCRANIKAGAFEFVDSQPEGEVFRAFMNSPLLKLKNFLVG